VLSSHELDRAEGLAHRVVHIAGGTTEPARSRSAEEVALVP
jgi:hypothetical protein